MDFIIKRKKETRNARINRFGNRINQLQWCVLKFINFIAFQILIELKIVIAFFLLHENTIFISAKHFDRNTVWVLNKCSVLMQSILFFLCISDKRFLHRDCMYVCVRCCPSCIMYKCPLHYNNIQWNCLRMDSEWM